MNSIEALAVFAEVTTVKDKSRLKEFNEAKHVLIDTTKAFEIIKEKRVDVGFVKYCLSMDISMPKQLSMYNEDRLVPEHKLTLSDFKLLKKVL